MRKRKCLFVGAVVITLLLSAFGTQGIEKSFTRGAELEVTTDKNVYEIGEIVTIFFTNIGDETLSAGGPIVSYYNEYNELIYQEAVYCWWKLEPGEFFIWTWNQKNFDNEQVPVGEYNVEGFLSGIEEDYIDTAIFNIINYDPPSSPYGPTEGVVNVSYTYCIDLPDNEEYEPYYIMWYWGDGTYTDWLGPYVAGETVCVNHFWVKPGDYEIRVKMKDCYNNEYLSDPLLVHIEDNSPPSAPYISGGPKNNQPICGIVGKEYEFTFNSVDPDGDDVYYFVDWGDGTYEDWFGVFGSGENATAKHTWNAQGTYTVRAKAKDIHGAESDWGTQPIPITGDKKINTLFFNFLQQHPRMFLIIRYVLGL